MSITKPQGVYLLNFDFQTTEGIEGHVMELHCDTDAAFSLHAKVRDSAGCQYAQLRGLIKEGPSKGNFEQLTTFRK